MTEKIDDISQALNNPQFVDSVVHLFGALADAHNKHSPGEPLSAIFMQQALAFAMATILDAFPETDTPQGARLVAQDVGKEIGTMLDMLRSHYEVTGERLLDQISAGDLATKH